MRCTDRRNLQIARTECGGHRCRIYCPCYRRYSSDKRRPKAVITRKIRLQVTAKLLQWIKIITVLVIQSRGFEA